ncbi:MAG: multicopper oxidase family protein [Kiloniellaceae bacterium]
MPARFPLTRRRLLQGGLALGAVNLSLPALVRAGEPRALTAGPGEALLLEQGQPKTRTWLYDGVSPGPVIRARQGEAVNVRLVNSLPQPTTIHWHGIRIDNAMDGVAHLTQAAVPPGESFDYRFTVPDAGTFWYHPHNRSWEQVARGLYGLLIVEEPRNVEVDQDVAIGADDWRLGDDGQIDEASFGHMMDWSHAGRLGNTLTLNGQDVLDIPVQSGERVRLRRCNTCNARVLELRIEDHQVWLMALDGQPVAPRELPDGYVRLAPGERADVVLDAFPDGLEPGKTAAITEVSGGQRLVAGRLILNGIIMRLAPLPVPPHSLPANPLSTTLDLANAQAVDLLMEGGAMGAMAQAMHNGQMMDMRGLVGEGMVWALNGVAGMTDTPLFSAPRGKTVPVTLRNDTQWPHAMHFHGHHFKVLERDGVATNSDAWKDTVLIDPQKTAKIAFVADNPGKWMIHCHMLEHQAGGMTTWFAVGA